MGAGGCAAFAATRQRGRMPTVCRLACAQAHFRHFSLWNSHNREAALIKT
jgi:hypothetical protein